MDLAADIVVLQLVAAVDTTFGLGAVAAAVAAVEGSLTTFVAGLTMKTTATLATTMQWSSNKTDIKSRGRKSIKILENGLKEC